MSERRVIYRMIIKNLIKEKLDLGFLTAAEFIIDVVLDEIE